MDMAIEVTTSVADVLDIPHSPYLKLNPENAVLLELFSSSFFEDAQNKGVGAVADMGGKALLYAGLAEDGFLGGTAVDN